MASLRAKAFLITRDKVANRLGEVVCSFLRTVGLLSEWIPSQTNRIDRRGLLPATPDLGQPLALGAGHCLVPTQVRGQQKGPQLVNRSSTVWPALSGLRGSTPRVASRGN